VNPRQVELVQQTFARTRPIAAHVAATFYAELFALEPSLRPMFKGDMIVQGDKLMQMLRYVVDGLTDPGGLLPTLRTLAIRHVEYGVEAHHYTTVGTALMRTLRHELGAEFTPEVREAWTAAYGLLTKVMCGAAYGEALAPSR
jgi:hemoglobin-like flavoprotein